jgi:hypothetical protein
MRQAVPNALNYFIIMLALLSCPVAILLLLYFYKPDIFTSMSQHSLDWLREKAIGWNHTPPVDKIDTHHHRVPPFYAKGKILISDKHLVPPQLTLY